MRLLPCTLAMSAALSPGCHCDGMDGQGTGTSTSSTGASSELTATATSSGASEESTSAPFDASRWIGRYHFELRFLPFGERGDPMGTYALMNFEVFADSTASLFYDDCAFDEPTVIAYTWEPAEPGWIELYPGAGESSLRLAAAEGLERVRVELVEPCRTLRFEVDGELVPWLPFRPGASCWFERCAVANTIHVDYCEGEEPPPCP